VGQLPTGEADLIVRGLAERVRIIRPRVPASVETVTQSLTALPQPRPATRGFRGRAVASREVPGPSSRVNPPFGSFNSGLTRLAVLRSGNTGRPQWARSPGQSTAEGRACSGRDRAGPARDAVGSQAVGDRVPDRHLQRPDRTPRFPATTPEVSGAPEPRSFRCDRWHIRQPVPAGPSCVSAGTSREDCGEPSRRHRLPYVPPVTGRR
jgi:hypothetical protein